MRLTAASASSASAAGQSQKHPLQAVHCSRSHAQQDCFSAYCLQPSWKTSMGCSYSCLPPLPVLTSHTRTEYAACDQQGLASSNYRAVCAFREQRPNPCMMPSPVASANWAHMHSGVLHDFQSPHAAAAYASLGHLHSQPPAERWLPLLALGRTRLPCTETLCRLAQGPHASTIQHVHSEPPAECMLLLLSHSQAALTCAGAFFIPPGGGHLVLRALAHAAVPQHAHAVVRPEGAVAPEADLQGRASAHQLTRCAWGAEQQNLLWQAFSSDEMEPSSARHYHSITFCRQIGTLVPEMQTPC